MLPTPTRQLDYAIDLHGQYSHSVVRGQAAVDTETATSLTPPNAAKLTLQIIYSRVEGARVGKGLRFATFVGDGRAGNSMTPPKSRRYSLHQCILWSGVTANMIRLVLAIAVLALFSLSCIGQSEVVTMGTEGAYPPYNFVNDEGEVDGFERELGDELCHRADLECVWVTNEWDTIIPNLVDGQYDTILAGMSITDERDEVIDFTQPYVPPTPSVYIALSGSGDDVVDGRVAAQVATIHADYLSESDATLIEYEAGRRAAASRPKRRGGRRPGR